MKLSTAALLALLMAPLSATATTVRGFDDHGLVNESSAVVRGTVITQYAVWDDGKTTIYTHSIVRIEALLAGRVFSDEIVVRQMGGQIGSARLTVPGTAPIHVGDDVALFLRHYDGLYTLVGMAQGMRKLSTVNGRTVMGEHTTHLETLKIRRLGPLAASPQAPAETWERWADEIRGIASVVGK